MKFKKLLMIWANDDAATAPAFVILQDHSLMLPFGDYMHANGLQRFDRAAAEAMANDMETVLSKLRLAVCGLPVYVGHPDLPAPHNEKYPDKRSYARIKGVKEITDEGLILETKWSNTGKALIEDGAYAFYSPYWGVEKIGALEDGRPIARPFRLYSVGLTNTPCIPVPALFCANSLDAPILAPTAALEAAPSATQMADEARKAVIARIAVAIGMDAGVDIEGLVAKITEMLAAIKKINASIEARWRAEDAARQATYMPPALAMANEALEALFAGFDEKLAAALAAERKARSVGPIQAAIADGRITPADIPKWENEFAGDFEAAELKLANTAPVLKTRTIADLTGRRPLADSGKVFLEAVHQRMTESREDFATAWANVKESKPQLYAAMK